MASALVSPQAMALSKAERVAEAASNKADALEAQLQAMQAELNSLRAAANRPAVDSGKVQELDQWMASVKSAPKEKKTQDNLIFFRGGFAHNDVKRNDLLTGNQFAGNALGQGQTNRDGWYIGAGFDFGLTDNVWGLMDNTDVMAELMFDYRNFGAKQYENVATSRALQGGATTNTSNNSLCTLINLAAAGGTAGTGLTGAAGTNSCNGVNVSQLTLAASPKIKFMKGSAFRPWIIPFGLTINVISPPSNGVTVLNPGMQFGTGAEYAIWKAIKVGADVRYNLTGRSVDGVNTDGMTAGGYLGIGF
ncbi:MAG: porin family protein [Methylobacter sp.]|nr:porin family protein [Methylobacter sp.]